MTASQLAFLIIRGLAILFFFQILGILAMAFISFGSLPPFMFFLYLVTITVFASLLLFMWFKADSISKKMISPLMVEDPQVSSFSKNDLMTVLIIVLGLFFISEAIQPFSMTVVVLGFDFFNASNQAFLKRGFWEKAIECVLLLGLGLYFVFNSSGLSFLINKARGRE